MENKITITPRSYNLLLQMQKNTSYSLAQIADIAIDYYFEDTFLPDIDLDAYLKNGEKGAIPLKTAMQKAGIECK